MSFENIVTKKELSDILKTSKANVSKLCRKKFKHAIQSDGRLNLNDPVIQEHIAVRAAKLDSVLEKKPKSKSQKKNQTNQTNAKPEVGNFFESKINEHYSIDPETIESLTIKEVVEIYGSLPGFKNVVDALKSISEYKNKELKYEQNRGEVIEKNPMADSLFSILDLAFKRLVGEYPSSINPELRAIAMSDNKNANIAMIELQEKAISRILKECKKEIIKRLNELKMNSNNDSKKGNLNE